MNKSTKVAAVAASVALAAAGTNGVANAQIIDSASVTSVLGELLQSGSAGGGLPTDSAGLPTDSAGLNPLAGSSDLTEGAIPGSSDLEPLAGSQAFTSSEPTLSTDPLGGSSDLPALSTAPLAGSAQLPGLEGSLSTLTLSTDVIGDVGSDNLGPLSTDLFATGSDQLHADGRALIKSLAVPLRMTPRLVAQGATRPRWA